MKLEKKEPGVPGIINLPDPAPGKGGRKVVVLALLAVLLVGGAAYWLTRDKDTRDHWRDQAAAVIDNATSGTPLAGVGDVPVSYTHLDVYKRQALRLPFILKLEFCSLRKSTRSSR